MAPYLTVPDVTSGPLDVHAYAVETHELNNAAFNYNSQNNSHNNSNNSHNSHNNSNNNSHNNSHNTSFAALEDEGEGKTSADTSHSSLTG